VSELVAKYEAGSPAQALAEEFEVGISTVLRIVRSRGGTVRGHGVSDKTRDEACRLYEAGLSVQKVADQLELTQSTTLRTLTRAGVAMRKRKNMPHT
jgi:transposase-like protein